MTKLWYHLWVIFDLGCKDDRSPWCNFVEVLVRCNGVGTVPYLFVGESSQAEDVGDDSDEDVKTLPQKNFILSLTKL